MDAEELAPPPPQRPDKNRVRNTIIQVVIGLVIAFIIFVLVLPQVIDYEQVWETLKGLSFVELLVLIVAGLILYVPEGWLYMICMPGMSYGRGVSSWIASVSM